MNSDGARERHLAAARRVIEEHFELAAETGASIDVEEFARAIVEEIDRTRH